MSLISFILILVMTYYTIESWDLYAEAQAHTEA